MSDEPIAPNTIDSWEATIFNAIKASSDDVRNKVVAHFVDSEIDRRAKLIIDGMNRLTEAETALSKIKADHILFGDDGKPLSPPAWTADQKGKRDKAQKLVDRLRTALNAAVADADFKLLEEALKSQSPAS